MSMKIEVDVDKCVAVGTCTALAPAVFDQRDDDGSVILLDPAPPESEHAQVREAAFLCPAAAIRLRESHQSGQTPRGTHV